MRWLMTKNRVALSISLSLSTDLLRHPASDTLYFQISQSWSSVESFIQHQGWLEDSRIPQGWVDASDNFLVSVDSMWRSDTLWDSEGGEAGKFSRLCEVPSRQSSESIATWKDWLSGRWGVVLVGKFSTLTFSSGSLGRWAVWPGLSPQEESPHPPQLLLSGSYLQLWPHWRGTSEVKLMTGHFF